MNKTLIKTLSNGNHIYKFTDGHGTPRYRVLRGKHWIGKTLDGGYISARAAKNFAMKNG